MPRIQFFSFALLIWTLSGVANAQPTHHIRITLDPAKHALTADDEIQLGKHSGRIEFYLNRSLKITAQSTPIENLGDVAIGDVPVVKYRAKLDSNQSSFKISYNGTLARNSSEQDKEYARSFAGGSGTIDDQGVFLSPEDAWYPLIGNEFVSFSLETKLPQKWIAVSQGSRKSNSSADANSISVWEESKLQEGIYLIAARFTEYHQAAGATQAMAFLREPDPALAQKYLAATVQYLEMYRQLIGPYPYSKFALVENRSPTGLGMPSFTLLGSEIIRMPFIINTSYPHEILHNWWGNGVYVDVRTGNWAEGITAYMSDHLTAEQNGQDIPQRRQILQHYTDFVGNSKDFPLTEFRSRHSSATEAIGYGKTQMVFHMLRVKYGDEIFKKAIAQFYRKYQFREASFRDLEKVFSDVTGKDLSGYFEQWVERTGAPILALDNTRVVAAKNSYQLRGRIRQTQQGDAYALDIPIAVTLDGESKAVESMVSVSSKEKEFIIEFAKRPVHVAIDPRFDIFRRVDLEEIPPALSQAFGAEKALIVLPSDASAAMKNGYQQLATDWAENVLENAEVKFDSEISTLPNDRAVWVIGWENPFLHAVSETTKQYNAALDKNGVTIENKKLLAEKTAVVVTARNLANPKQAIAFIATNNAKAIPGLARKLPHYRKYSYLSFEGDEPKNDLKGQWPVNRSPMQKLLVNKSKENASITIGELPQRPPLASLPSVFNESRMMADVKKLANEDMAGRGLGSKELERAAEYIAAEFKTAGLAPGGENESSYFQRWKENVSGLNKEVSLTNVIAIVPGNNPKYQIESVVVSAHYDHLGLGWPDVRKGNEGKIHYGADDNASGVAVMLELARMAVKWKPERSIVFIAFTAEEAGSIGAQYYVNNYQQFPAKKIIGVLNLDTVGRVGSDPVRIFSTGTASEWPHIFRGAQFVTGVKTLLVDEHHETGDQKIFIKNGIPAVQFFGSVHADFHSPGDTADKIDSAGMVKVASLLKEAVEYLSSRPNPMTITIKGATTAQPSSAQTRPQGRNVSVGTIPDFDYQGNGVRITGVSPQSPAEKAGLKNGDIITGINKKVINNLAEYSAALREFKVGQKITLEYRRDNKMQEVDVVVIAR